MKSNRFLKLTSILLSVSTLLGSFYMPRTCALSLSKSAKIGIGVSAVGVVGIGLLTGLLWSNHREHAEDVVVGSEDTAWGLLQTSLNNSAYKDTKDILTKKLGETEGLQKTLSDFKFGDADSVASNGMLNISLSDGSGISIPPFFECVVWANKKDLSRGALKNFVAALSSKAKDNSIDNVTVRIQYLSEQPHTSSLPGSSTSDSSRALRVGGMHAGLRERAKALSTHTDPTSGSRFRNNWEQLCYLLGSPENIHWVETNYPEWKDRLQNHSQYSKIQFPGGVCERYENFALMSIAYSLLLAKSENYDAGDSNNNELIVGLPDISGCAKKRVTNTKEVKESYIEVVNEDILQCAQNHFDEWELNNKIIGLLNAGDPYDPCGFLPNSGCALEEYLAMMTTLVRDISHKVFRIGHPDCKNGGFYTTREVFRPVCEAGRRPVNVFGRLTGPGREFYHTRGIMSKKVRLIRPLERAVWDHPESHTGSFNVASGGLGSKTFYVLSIAGLEDRSKTLLAQGDTCHTAAEYREQWKEITKKQCRFVLHAFIKEGVDVLFLCAFGAGCFGGSATIVAECFKELLIDEGYADYFDRVVFPIIGGNDPLNGGQPNIYAFYNAFEKPYAPIAVG